MSETTLLAEDHETYSYPVDGWYWVETEEDFYLLFN